MSDFAALTTAYTGIRAAQASISTVADNIANVGTVGFTRRRTDLVARSQWDSAVGPLGAGVDVREVTRIRDGFLDARFRIESARAGDTAARAALLGAAEEVLGEPDHGITGVLSGVWSAFEDLGLNPSSPAARQVALSSLDSLASRFRDIARGYDTLAADTAAALDTTVVEANDLLRQVADLNRAIIDAGRGGGSPNVLLDTRDRLIDDLAARIGVQTSPLADGTVRVTLDGHSLVDGQNAYAITKGLDGTLRHATGRPLTLGGAAGGAQAFLTTDLANLRAQLDGLATDVTTAINAQHALGLASGGAPGVPLLVAADGTARTLRLATTDPSALATGLTGATHDGQNAAAIAALRTADIGGRTLDARARGVATELGARVAAAQDAAEAQSAIAVSSETGRERQHGVSLEEEMVALVSHQRALEAASRVLTAVDQALDVLINRTGVVGR